jgi:hypothetical protein
MRLPYPILPFLVLLACGPQGGTSDDSSSTGTPPANTTGGATEPGATTGTTGEPTAPTTTTLDPTTDGGTITASTGTTTGVDDTGLASSTTTLATEAQTTGEPPGPGQCLEDSDCKLHDDCCTCQGVPLGEDVVFCDEECKQSKCSELGVTAAACRHGVCETARLSCDQVKVVCDQNPPPCPEGQLPTTTPACWTGQCVPAELCDVVPDCGACPPGKLCVQQVGFGVQATTCEPIPPGCGGVVDCACAGELVCTDEFKACFDQPGDVISCECLNC